MKKIIKIIKHQIFLIQFEDYSISRSLSAISGFFKNKGYVPSGKKIKWTPKLFILITLSILISIVIPIALGFLFDLDLLWKIRLLIILLILLLYFIFIPLALSVILFYPIDFLSKKLLVYRARLKLKKYRDKLKIVAITGSYGKTTMKEGVKMVLSEKYTVLSTEGNQNTLIGVSRCILDKLNPNIEVFVVEMAAYGNGDIKELCDFVHKPEVAILTGINESHFERFKSIENTINTKFEIVQNSSEEGLVILNSDDRNVLDNHKRFIGERKVKFYSSSNNELSEFYFKEKEFVSSKASLNFKIEEKGNAVGIFELPFITEYIIAIAISSSIVGKQLGMSWEEINKGINNFSPVEHRLRPIKAKGGILIIDDSYNGNPEGVSKAIDALSLFEGRRKIYVTPGLAEVGDRNDELHKEIGSKLSKVADLVILEENDAGRFIKQGLLSQGFLEKYIKVYKSIHDGHVDLDNILIENDVILFQRGRSQFLFNWIDSKKL